MAVCIACIASPLGKRAVINAASAQFQLHATSQLPGPACLPMDLEVHALPPAAAGRSRQSISNSIFGKVGRIASHDTVLHLVKSKCLPILLYGLEVLPFHS